MKKILLSVMSIGIFSSSVPAMAEEKPGLAPVCLENSKLCIPRANPPVPSRAGAALKLAIPKEKVREAAAQINAAVPENDDQEPTNYVEVRGERTTADIPGGLGSFFWAAKNPSQAWRIFLPVTTQ